jgi:hypothetical protein
MSTKVSPFVPSAKWKSRIEEDKPRKRNRHRLCAPLRIFDIFLHNHPVLLLVAPAGIVVAGERDMQCF